MCLRLISRIAGVAFLRREIFTSDQFNSSFPLLCFCNKWKRAKRECWKKVWNWKWRFPSRFQSESERRWGDRRRPNKNPTDSSDRKMPLSKLLGVRMRRTVMVAVIILMRKLSLGINILFSIFITDFLKNNDNMWARLSCYRTVLWCWEPSIVWNWFPCYWIWIFLLTLSCHKNVYIQQRLANTLVIFSPIECHKNPFAQIQLCLWIHHDSLSRPDIGLTLSRIISSAAI